MINKKKEKNMPLDIQSKQLLENIKKWDCLLYTQFQLMRGEKEWKMNFMKKIRNKFNLFNYYLISMNT